MTDAIESNDAQLKDKVQDLIYQITSTDRVRQLLLASTPEVAEKIAQSFPELSELQLYGAIATTAVADAIKSLNDDRLIPLLVAVKQMKAQAALPALAEKVGQLKDESTFNMVDYIILSTFDTVSGACDYASDLTRKRLVEFSKSILDSTTNEKK